ncbi:hypothetical protein BDZ97DRAFT_237989 [Flammula alnicola]|nr:hypothetical protein BDZ97DRAFT_237989 [Flammula alnicola]
MENGTRLGAHRRPKRFLYLHKVEWEERPASQRRMDVQDTKLLTLLRLLDSTPPCQCSPHCQIIRLWQPDYMGVFLQVLLVSHILKLCIALPQPKFWHSRTAYDTKLVAGHITNLNAAVHTYPKLKSIECLWHPVQPVYTRLRADVELRTTMIRFGYDLPRTCKVKVDSFASYRLGRNNAEI